MRVRLYEMGSRCTGMVLIDHFPVGLALGVDGGLCPNEIEQSVCSLEEVGGQILLRSQNDQGNLSVNDAPLEQGLLQPGDRLQLGERSYLVSYEQTSREMVAPPRFKILS